MKFQSITGKPLHRAVGMYAEECKAGVLSRREFLTRATALGATSAAAYALLGLDAPARALAGDLGNLLADVTTVEWFRSIGESVGIVTGFIFIVCVLLFRRGIVGEIAAKLERAPVR